MQILILIFAEVLGLYGLIVALIMNSRASDVTNAVCLFTITFEKDPHRFAQCSA